MKKTLSVLAILLLCGSTVFAQKMEKEMPKGYEQEKTGIAKGKIDTVLYESKTVGNKRKTLVYTPQGSTKRRNILFSICYMALVATTWNGLKEQVHKTF